eukprot:TRINITY_DN14173_c0_g1_i3.p1 TRINITY_DN14173_c0_g1~~TRINITY_DN14173_c0_g1_i3.p1  ORF type:complete len:735 (-),score=93.60 TRINITY_DN14173_c0_g1_i3:251-2455(-)
MSEHRFAEGERVHAWFYTDWHYARIRKIECDGMIQVLWESEWSVSTLPATHISPVGEEQLDAANSHVSESSPYIGEASNAQLHVSDRCSSRDELAIESEGLVTLDSQIESWRQSAPPPEAPPPPPPPPPPLKRKPTEDGFRASAFDESKKSTILDGSTMVSAADESISTAMSDESAVHQNIETIVEARPSTDAVRAFIERWSLSDSAYSIVSSLPKCVQTGTLQRFKLRDDVEVRGSRDELLYNYIRGIYKRIDSKHLLEDFVPGSLDQVRAFGIIWKLSHASLLRLQKLSDKHKRLVVESFHPDGPHYVLDELFNKFFVEHGLAKDSIAVPSKPEKSQQTQNTQAGQIQEFIVKWKLNDQSKQYLEMLSPEILDFVLLKFSPKGTIQSYHAMLCSFASSVANNKGIPLMRGQVSHSVKFADNAQKNVHVAQVPSGLQQHQEPKASVQPRHGPTSREAVKDSKKSSKAVYGFELLRGDSDSESSEHEYVETASPRAVPLDDPVIAKASSNPHGDVDQRLPANATTCKAAAADASCVQEASSLSASNERNQPLASTKQELKKKASLATENSEAIAAPVKQRTSSISDCSIQRSHDACVHHCTFTPGDPGIGINKLSGRVTYVAPRGQANRAGVREDWIVHEVEGERYSESLIDKLRSCIEGSSNFTVSFVDSRHESYAQAKAAEEADEPPSPTSEDIAAARARLCAAARVGRARLQVRQKCFGKCECCGRSLPRP